MISADAGAVPARVLPRAVRSQLKPLRQLRDRWARALLRRRANAIARKYRGFTMIRPRKFVDNLLLAAKVRERRGCVVECGVWRGGMSAGIAEILGPSRHYYLFDSFEGLPPAQDIDGVAARAYQQNPESPSYHENCKAEMAFAERAMALSGAAKVTLRKGWFSVTLPGFVPDEGIALLRLDGDWYESTMQCLESLYQHVVPGGLIIIDDYYYWEGCAKAVHDFLSKHNVADRIQQSPGGVCFIVRRRAE
jgi:O-methyltransferase